MTENEITPAPKTDFLQTVGMIFICLSGLLSVVTAFFGLIFKLMSFAQSKSDADILGEFLKGFGSSTSAPGLTIDLILNVLWAGLFVFLLSLGISIGVYFKQKWARIPFIAISGLFISASLGLLYWLWGVYAPPQIPSIEGDGAEIVSAFQSTLTVLTQGGKIVNTFSILAGDIALILVIRKFLHPDTIAEFEKK